MLRRLFLYVLALALAAIAHAHPAYASGNIKVSVSPDTVPARKLVQVTAVGLRDPIGTAKTTYYAQILLNYHVVKDNVPVGHVTQGWFRGTLDFGADCDVPAAEILVDAPVGQAEIGVGFYAKDPTGVRTLDDGRGYVRVTPSPVPPNVVLPPPSSQPPPPPPPPLAVQIKEVAPMPYKTGAPVSALVNIQGTGDATLTGTVEHEGTSTAIWFPPGEANKPFTTARAQKFGSGLQVSITTQGFTFKPGTNTIRFTLTANGQTVTAVRTINVPRPKDYEPEPKPPHKPPPSKPRP